MPNSDEHALLLQISYDLNKLKSQGDKATGEVDRALSAIEKRAKRTAIELEESLSFKNINAGAALTNVLGGLKEDAIRDASSQLGVLGSSLGALGPLGLLAAGGITAAGFAIERGMKTAEWAEDLEHASYTLNLTTTQLQKFDFIAQALNIPIGAMRESLSGLNTQIGLVESGLARSMTVKAFTDGLKITPEQLKGWGDFGTQLPHIVDALAAMNVQERDGVMSRLKLDPQVVNTLIEERDRLKELNETMAQYGLVMDSTAIAKSAEAAAQIHIASTVIQDEMNVAFADMAPLAVGAAQGVAGLTSDIRDLASWARTAFGPLADLLGLLRGAPSGGGESVASMAIGAIPVVGDLYEKARAGMDASRRQRLALQAVHAGIDGLAPIAGPKPTTLSTPKAHKGHAGLTDDAAQADADQAAKLLADAQKGLATTIAARAKFEQQALDAEQGKADAKLDGDLKKAKTASAKAAIAQAVSDTDQAYALKGQLLARQTAQALAEQDNALSRIGLEGQEAMLRAQEGLGVSAENRAQIERQLFELDERLAENKLNEVIGSNASKEAIAQAQAELANLRGSAPTRRKAVSAEGENQIKAQQYAMAELGLQGQADMLDAEKAVGKTTEQRSAIALKLFALDEQLQELKLNEVIATTAAGTAENDRARAELANLQATLSLRSQAANDANPTNSWSAWVTDARNSVNDVGEAFAKARVDGVEAFNAKLFDGEGRFQGLGNAARAFGQTALVSLERWGLKAAEVGLLGGGDQGGGLFGLFGGKGGSGSGGGILGSLFGGKGSASTAPDGTALNPIYVSFAGGSGAAVGLPSLLSGGAATAGGKAANGGGFLSSILGGLGHIVGLAGGGEFTVGGPAGIDRNLAVMKLSRNEHVSVETEAQQRAGKGRGVGDVHFHFPNSSVDGFRKSERQVARDTRRAVGGWG